MVIALRDAMQNKKKNKTLLSCHCHHGTNKHEPSHPLIWQNFLSSKQKNMSKQLTTLFLLPTRTKLLMSDSSVLICCANFIGELRRLWKHLGETKMGEQCCSVHTHTVAPSRSCYGGRRLEVKRRMRYMLLKRHRRWNKKRDLSPSCFRIMLKWK